MTPRLLVLAEALDAATMAAFYWIVGPSEQLAERNPLVLAIMAVGGVQLVGLAKVGLAVVAERRWPRITHTLALRSALVLAVLSGIVGAGANIASLLWSLGVRA